MAASKKTPRKTLESFFKAGEIPLEENFADLIASGLNQVDDGIEKSISDPLKIQSGQDDPQEVLRFYTDLKGDSKWTISLKNGLNIGNSQHIFIMLF